ncbi:hypothetical protein [Leptospira levettii]|nr:hypothetical protein [Leptospira levettii]
MKLVFQKIGLRYLLNLGVNHQLDLQTSVRVQLANLIAILGILSNIQYSILFVIAGAPNVWIMNCIHLSVITIFSYILYLNFKEQYSIARILLIFTISIPLVFVSFISFGNSGGFYYYFLVFALAPFVLFSY